MPTPTLSSRLPCPQRATPGGGCQLRPQLQERNSASTARSVELQQQGDGPKQRTLQGFDNLSWAIHPSGEFVKGSASSFYHWCSNEDEAQARRGASERARMQEAPAAHSTLIPPRSWSWESCASIPGRAVAPSHPTTGSEPLPPCGGQSLRSMAGMRQAGSAGPHPARRARAVIHIPPAVNHRCPCAPSDPAAAETMRAMLVGSRGGRGHRAPQRWLQEWGAVGAVGGPQP